MNHTEPDRLLTPSEVAKRLRVDPKTVSRWAAAGQLNGIRTPGGQWRFRKTDIDALVDFEGANRANA